MPLAEFSVPDNEGRQHVYTGEETTIRLLAVKTHSIGGGSSARYSFSSSFIKVGVTYLSGGMASFPNPSSSKQFRLSEGFVKDVSIVDGRVDYEIRNDASFTISFNVYIYGRS